MTKRKSKDKDVPNSRILLISDLHCPFNHPDAVDFLRELDNQYNFNKIIGLGDELDKHSLSYHESNPDLPSAGDELEQGLVVMRQLYDLFPVVQTVESNHTSLGFRKAMTAGIPRKYLKAYKELLEAPEGWSWHEDLIVSLPNGTKLYVCHGKTSNGAQLSREYGMNSAQGHHHTLSRIEYISTPTQLLWAIQAGCLINPRHVAFSYQKQNLKRPIISTGLVIDSHPKIAIMELDKKHSRWTGRVIV